MIQLEAKCSTWSSFLNLFSGDLDHASVQIPTSQPARQNDAVQICLYTPDGFPLLLQGIVSDVISTNNQIAALKIKLNMRPGPHRNDLEERLAKAELLSAGGPDGDDDIPIFEESQLFRLPDSMRTSAPDPVAKPRKQRATAQTNQVQDQIIDEQQAPKPVQTQPTPSTPPPATLSRGTTIAIDFGTTNACVAVLVNNLPTVVQLPDGANKLPAVIAFLQNETVTVGHDAKSILLQDPHRVITAPLRLIGRRYNDPQLQPYLKNQPISLIQGVDNNIQISSNGHHYSVAQLSATVLHYLKQAAEYKIGQPAQYVALSVPAESSETLSDALKETAELAGLTLKKVVPAPVAAALANRSDTNYGKLIAVYDFGGGTFTFSVLDSSVHPPSIVGYKQEYWLGGNDFDEALANAAANTFWRQSGIEVRRQPVQWQRLLDAAEEAKRTLTAKPSATIELTEMALTDYGPVNLSFSLNRTQFTGFTEALIERSLSVCQQVLMEAGKGPNEIKAVYLSGGTTYIPSLRVSLAKFFGKPARMGVAPELAVAIGTILAADD